MTASFGAKQAILRKSHIFCLCYQTKSSTNSGNILSGGYRSDFKRLSDLVCTGPDTELLSEVCPICCIQSDENTTQGLGTSIRNTRGMYSSWCRAPGTEPQTSHWPAGEHCHCSCTSKKGSLWDPGARPHEPNCAGRHCPAGRLPGTPAQNKQGPVTSVLQ